MQRDIVIAGGGMVGVSLALQLAAVLPDAVGITLIEKTALPANASSRVDYHPSFDARTTALSASSRHIYSALGLWAELAPGLCPIERIHVSHKGRFGSTLLTAGDMGWSELGGVVDNAWLGRVLLSRLRGTPRIEVMSSAQVVSAQTESDGVTLTLETESDPCLSIKARLLLIADGADSNLRQLMGFTVRRKASEHHALISNVALAQPHNRCAFERFTRAGPLALLPLLPSAEAEHRAALIWSLPQARATALLDVEADEFINALQADFGYRLGKIKAVGRRLAYPLQLLDVPHQARRGVLVVGNAAHSLHPVAGQGFNLALRDVAVLAQFLAQSLAAGEALGDTAVLLRYQAQQAQDQQRTVAFSDHLPQLFMRDLLPLELGRGAGLASLDLVPSARRAFVRFAAGQAALEEVRDAVH